MTTTPRFLRLDGILNLRELGGYTAPSRTLRWHKLLRSGGLDLAPPISQQALLDYGVTHIVDIRDQWEQQRYRNAFTDVSTVRYQNLPFIGDDQLQDETAQRIMKEDPLAATYILMLERCQPQIKRIFEAIANSSQAGCTVIHCFAGKDRTGLIVALLLGTLDVAQETIIADYILSDDDLSFAKAETMWQTLTYLQSKHNGINGYLHTCGISDATLSTLRQHLLE